MGRNTFGNTQSYMQHTFAMLSIYNILNNILYVNNKLCTCKITNPLCCFCKHENETVLHIFYSCNLTCRIWSQLKSFLEPNLILPYLLTKTATIGFLEKPDN